MPPKSFWLHQFICVLVVWILTLPAIGFSATYFVATNGLDGNTGTSNSPFATIMHAQSVAAAGDTVYLRGGRYILDNSNFTTTNSPWAIVNDITKNGISYLAYPGELPVFDFSNVKPTGFRVTAFHVKARSCVFKGFDVVGVQVTIQTTHTQSECFRIDGGSQNRFEQLRMHDGMANGWYLTGGASNLVLNCDAYNNAGLDVGSIGNTDGFGCHPGVGGRSNILSGCRSWFNSDDGFDCINSSETVRFENCWSFYNGFTNGFVNLGGDGNGFKAGGYGAAGSALPNPIPRHAVLFCLAVRNKASGFYSNHHATGSDWINDTAYHNGANFNMLCVSNDNLTSIPGFSHLMKNNLGYKGGTEVENLGTSNDDTVNYFNLPVTVATNDFVTLDESLLMAPRQADGSLPYIGFARLTNSSDCIDIGTNMGFAFFGHAPDLGAFEFGPTNGPAATVQATNGNVIISVNGWANRTNCLMASSDLTLAPSLWTSIATNVSDGSGNCAFTNVISNGTLPQFYRLQLPNGEMGLNR
jgi:hypothetical protein